MNNCPQCLKILPESGEACSTCGFSLVKDVTKSHILLDLDKTQATKILGDKSMTPEKWQRMKGLFEAAQDISPDKRERFLKNACGDDGELKSEVEKLLGSFESAESFMESPAVAEAISMFEEKKTLAANQTTGEIQNSNFVAGTVLDGRYRIIGLLGKGGMGEVYRAEDLKLNQVVALKFLPEKLEKDKATLDRFIGEVRTARQVSHTNVCRVFDIGDIGGKHFISMEFIDGDDLSQLLRRIGRLPSDKAVEISRQICFGLHAIHDAGILHRDLKPANIIIDSKGKARITDFGIAGIEADISKEEVRVGTPAYMSPEQITGKEVTTKSDIYSLGLLVYEIFTGKQAFKADSLNELIEKHKTTTPTNPSEFVENIDPIVEKTINRCLEKNPNDRPKSALQVALALPGGNPLEAAIAAGETPSPEMVAAAPKKGALKPMIALGLLAAFFIAFVGIAWLNQSVKIYNFIPLEKSADVLAEKSKTILEKFGYADAAADSVYRFEQDNSFIRNVPENVENISQVKKMLGFGQPSEIYFLYRQSPLYLEPKGSGNVTESEPPLTAANMANVKLDTRGRLFEFVAVPPLIVKSAEKREFNWNALFIEAGLDISKFKETESNWTPPVFADERRTWKGSLADLPEIPISIEAAAYNGKLVFFRIVTPWNNPADETAADESVFRKTGVIFIILIYCLVIIGSIFLARHNLKVGRGDLRGGLKLTIFLFLLNFAGQIIYDDHIPAVWSELSIIYQTFSQSLISALFVGLIYIALEPFVRRHWSELLISWNRLLAGDFRDPLIGRDVLVGGLLGIGHTFGIYFGSVLVSRITGLNEVLNEVYPPTAINGFPGIFYVVTNSLANAVLSGFILLFILLGLYMLLKRKKLSVFLIFFLIFSLQSLFFVLTQHWGFIFSAVFNAVCFTVALSRFGLLGAISFWMFFYMSYMFPVTFDNTNPFFPSTIATFILAFGLAAYAFYISIAGQPFFGDNVLKETE